MPRSLHFLAAALLSALPLAPAAAQAPPPKEASPVDKARDKAAAADAALVQAQLKYDSGFAVAASSGNLLAAALGGLAAQKATALEVKDWGKQQDADLTQLQTQLQGIAGRAAFALPAAMSAADRKTYDDVNDRKYLGFDKKYLRDLKELHQHLIALYADAATQATNPELRAFAADALPKLRAHGTTTAQLFDRANARK
ncbi:DUF4142 domain-containing protein [Hymenobacter caeli]|uniref:Membrane protein n=1 Tax=Hymenobacter caeli TaxID=2735894 RepID=A0ABX2FV33_9BACT|nr:DUF4142 domain-containing protein [Hymenobacter caeli]NRT20270.1 putative membrane protein [Hymenobacter caeli]